MNPIAWIKRHLAENDALPSLLFGTFLLHSGIGTLTTREATLNLCFGVLTTTLGVLFFAAGICAVARRFPVKCVGDVKETGRSGN